LWQTSRRSPLPELPPGSSLQVLPLEVEMAAGIRQLRLLLQDAEPGMDLVRTLVMKVALDAKVAHRVSLEVNVIKHFLLSLTVWTNTSACSCLVSFFQLV
jgi:hypothetical protein